MRFDFQAKTSHPSDLLSHVIGGKCFVDGRQIAQVWFADTETGVVKTYDVFGDGKARATCGGYSAIDKPFGDVLYTPADFPGREVECPLDGAVSEMLRGKVELIESADGPARRPAHTAPQAHGSGSQDGGDRIPPR